MSALNVGKGTSIQVIAGVRAAKDGRDEEEQTRKLGLAEARV